MKTLDQLGISPAPWEDDCGEVFDADDRTIATHANLKEGFSNCTLIAAAPDLYEAVAAMLSCVEKESPFTDQSGMSIAMDMARKAIKKAGGAE